MESVDCAAAAVETSKSMIKLRENQRLEIEEIQKTIDNLERKKKFLLLAHACYETVSENGALVVKCKFDRNYIGRKDVPDGQMVAEAAIAASSNTALVQGCFGKYGLSFIKNTCVRGGYEVTYSVIST